MSFFHLSWVFMQKKQIFLILEKWENLMKNQYVSEKRF